MPVHLIVASVAFLCAVSAVGTYFLVRLYFLRRLRQAGDIEQIYGPYDMPTAVRAEVLDHADLHFDFGTSGKDWQLDFKCKGRIRLFLWVHAYYMTEFAWHRLAEERFPFLWWHSVCLSSLCAIAALKILFWPHSKDVLALVGFDTITAEKLLDIKAGLEQTDSAPIE